MDISQLAFICTSKSKAQEIFLLLHDVKEVVRQGYYNSELPAINQFCQQNQLCLVKSKFKVLLADQDHFTNKGLRLPDTDTDPRPKMSFVYISKDEKKALLASYYELIDNHRELGSLLGYPLCCIDAFCQRFCAENPNPQVSASNPFIDISKRKQDLVLISHFPCSGECTESISLAQRYYQALCKLDHSRAQEICKGLKIIS